MLAVFYIDCINENQIFIKINITFVDILINSNIRTSIIIIMITINIMIIIKSLLIIVINTPIAKILHLYGLYYKFL